MFLKHVTRDGSAGTRLRGSYYGDPMGYPGLLPLIRTWPSRRCFPPGCCYLSRCEAEETTTEEDTRHG